MATNATFVPPERSNTASTSYFTPISPPRRTETETDYNNGLEEVNSASHWAAASSANGATHQRIVLSDPVALFYLEEDASTTVLERARELLGYQTYIVEQWACSRTHPTFVITAFTGDPSHKIKVGIISVPSNEKSWSPRLRVYFKTVAQYYARRRDTALGALMVTNLSTFPSSLTIVLIPDGELKKNREHFFVSENLKRLACSGRVGLSVTAPSLPTKAKFHQLYRVSDKIDFNSSVIELVKLCQVSLVLFGCFGSEYCDGLLCDVTERAASDWWIRFGAELFSVDPGDIALSPELVSALLGTLIGARNRLKMAGISIAKDVFDVETTKRAISAFQKTQRLPRTRRLDKQTLDLLHKVTAKQASGEGWGMSKAVKSTMAELSGKGGEMVMEMVGKNDKALIGEIETTDIERFAQLVKGERARWLWHGKSRKRTTRDLFDRKADYKAENPKPEKDLHRGITRENTAESLQVPDENYKPPLHSPGGSEGGRRSFEDASPGDVKEKESTYRRAKGRLRGATGLKTAFGSTRHLPLGNGHGNKSYESLNGLDLPASSVASARSSAELQRDGEFDGPRLRRPGFAATATAITAPAIDEESGSDQSDKEARYNIDDSLSASDGTIEGLDEIATEDKRAHIGRLLRRSQSVEQLPTQHNPRGKRGLFPRNLSFSLADDVFLRAKDWNRMIDAYNYAGQGDSPENAMRRQLMRSERARLIREEIAALTNGPGAQALAALKYIQAQDSIVSQDVDQLRSMHNPRHEEHAGFVEEANEIVEQERAQLTEALKDLETLGAQLDYEIGGLRDRVDEIGDAVDEFARRVAYIEGRVDDLVDGGRITRATAASPAGGASDARDVTRRKHAVMADVKHGLGAALEGRAGREKGENGADMYFAGMDEGTGTAETGGPAEGDAGARGVPGREAARAYAWLAHVAHRVRSAAAALAPGI